LQLTDQLFLIANSYYIMLRFEVLAVVKMSMLVWDKNIVWYSL
jgi:hypothetical protein